MTAQTLFDKLWAILFSPQHMGNSRWNGPYSWTIGGRRFSAFRFSAQWRFVFQLGDHHYGVERDGYDHGTQDYTYKWYDPTLRGNVPSDEALFELMMLL